MSKIKTRGIRFDKTSKGFHHTVTVSKEPVLRIKKNGLNVHSTVSEVESIANLMNLKDHFEPVHGKFERVYEIGSKPVEHLFLPFSESVSNKVRKFSENEVLKFLNWWNISPKEIDFSQFNSVEDFKKYFEKDIDFALKFNHDSKPNIDCNEMVIHFFVNLVTDYDTVSDSPELVYVFDKVLQKHRLESIHESMTKNGFVLSKDVFELLNHAVKRVPKFIGRNDNSFDEIKKQIIAHF